MNKIKLLYDVVSTMKAKELFSGSVTAEARKEGNTIFSVQNEFAKNMATGHTKMKICTRLDYDGKKISHEGHTEFSMHNGDENTHHRFLAHLRHHHEFNHQGIKGKLSRLALALSMLNSLQVEERDDKMIVISLNTDDLPEDIHALIQERMKMNHVHTGHHHDHQHFMTELCTMEKCNFTCRLLVNQQYEIEKITATLDGIQGGEENEPHKVQGNAEMALNW